ncbi:hypothetical protein F5Y04DRAFT_290077 [Hypomontagnella monticulosa]|nr:hypothetical protein F5Y04DRAFT_290077 [Hypomontagnella monticulosa]
MGKQQHIMTWLAIFIILLPIQAHLVNGFPWSSEPSVDSNKKDVASSAMGGGSLPQLLGSGFGSRLPSSYETALNELRELESEPLCHKTAARLLINNCQLLEDKNAATVLTESGRAIRDFVDAYAASLAICDLERGSFQIPTACNNFREPALNQLPHQNLGHLHNTWVSYRHKALRFCEAARADNEKDQQIILFQRLTEIMGRFIGDIDKQFEQHMDDLDLRTQATAGKINDLSPQVDHLKDSLVSLQNMLLDQLNQAVKETTDVVNSGADNAVNLQRMFEVIINGALEGQAELSSAYERSIQLANQRAESAVDTAAKAIALAAESATHLGSQLEFTRLQAMDLATRQDNLEQGMQRLTTMTEGLTTTYDDHTELLNQARNLTDEILGSLEETAASVTYVGNSIKQSPTSSWWPYVWCPAASLILGSYGLPPSATRNLVLIALGEVAGLTVSSIQSIHRDVSSSSFVKFSTLLYTWGPPSPTPFSASSNDTNKTEEL